MSTTTRRSRRKTTSRAGKAAATGQVSETVSEHQGGERVSESAETSHIDRVIASKHPAYVRVAGGRTINLGDFESLRIDVSIELPSEPNTGSILGTYDEATALLDRLMGERINKHIK